MLEAIVQKVVTDVIKAGGSSVARKVSELNSEILAKKRKRLEKEFEEIGKDINAISLDSNEKITETKVSDTQIQYLR